MKKLRSSIAIVFLIFITSCGQSIREPDGSATEDDKAEIEKDGLASFATFTINDQKYSCNDVGAIGDKKENKLIINATSIDVDETVFFSFTLKEIGEGQKKFGTSGNLVQFSTAESYGNTHKADCTDENVFTDGTITITKLVDYSPERDGRVEGNFEGQLSIKRNVPAYPCGNGNSSNSKTELVTVKGSFACGYINTKELPVLTR